MTRFARITTRPGRNRVPIDPAVTEIEPPGSAGGSISVTDGTTTVVPATSLHLPVGTLTDLGGGEASVAVGTPVLLVSGHGSPEAGANQQYSITYNNSSPSSGSFRVVVDGTPTTVLPWGLTLGDLIAAIEVIVGAGNCIIETGSGGALSDTLDSSGYLFIEFAGTKARTAVVVTISADTTGSDLSIGEDALGVAPVPAGMASGSWYLDTVTFTFHQNIGTLIEPVWQWDNRVPSLDIILANGALTNGQAMSGSAAIGGTIAASWATSICTKAKGGTLVGVVTQASTAVTCLSSEEPVTLAQSRVPLFMCTAVISTPGTRGLGASS